MLLRIAMRRGSILSAWAFVIAAAGAIRSTALAEVSAVRYALIIGNCDYDGNGRCEPGDTQVAGSLEPLNNPCNDATAIAGRLEALGWSSSEGAFPRCNLR